MIGDNIDIRPVYLELCDQLIDTLKDRIFNKSDILCIAIGGESGCGKSTLSLALHNTLLEKKVNSIVFHQDDYFVLPPKSNHQNRLKCVSNVGIHEVKLSLLNSHIDLIKTKNINSLIKPLVFYTEDEIRNEEISVSDLQVVIVEGTYTMLLNSADIKIFMSRNYEETKEYRINRGRDIISEFNEEVVIKEHHIIKKHKELADFIIDADMKIHQTNLNSAQY